MNGLIVWFIVIGLSLLSMAGVTIFVVHDMNKNDRKSLKKK